MTALLPSTSSGDSRALGDLAVWAALSPRQAEFLACYTECRDSGKAYVAAYRRTPGATPTWQQRAEGTRVLSNPKVRRALATLYRRRQAVIEVSQDRLMLELARIAFFDIRKLYRPDGTLKPLSELDDDTAAALNSVDVVYSEDGTELRKVKAHDKVAAGRTMSQVAGWNLTRTETTSPGGTFVVEGLNDDDASNVDDLLY